MFGERQVPFDWSADFTRAHVISRSRGNELYRVIDCPLSCVYLIRS